LNSNDSKENGSQNKGNKKTSRYIDHFVTFANVFSILLQLVIKN
jgi:hypothetical protein